jgi:hypothetical protein
MSEADGSERAQWIWMARRSKEVNCHLLLRTEFDLPVRPTDGRLRIAAGDQYRLLVNGRLVGDGPARSERPTAYVDTYPLGELRLRKGLNCIAVLAHSTMLPQHGQSLVPGGLWVELECLPPSGRPVRIVSDETWRVAPAPQFLKPAPRRFFAVGFNEKFDFAAEPRGWQELGFDDSGWQTAVRVGNRPYSRLVDRPIPMLRFEDWRPARVRRCGSVGPLDAVWGLAFQQCETLPAEDELTFGTFVHSDRARTAVFSFGCDNWSRLRLNGRLVWEQGRPDAGFTNHLQYDRDKYPGMLSGNGHRFEPGSSRRSAAKRSDHVRLRRGWNSLTVWLKWPHRTYGFEGCFFDAGTGEPIAVTCSAARDQGGPHAWSLLSGEDAPVEEGCAVRTTVPEVRPYLEPSHLADWDRQTERQRAFSGARSLLARPQGAGPMTLPPGGFVEFQLPADGVGFIDLELRGPEGTLVDVTIAEAQTRDGRMRSLYNGLWQTDRLILSGRWDRWLSLDRRAGRYLGICVRRGTGPVQVRRLALKSQHYPVERPGRFECSDWTLTRMWQAGAATVDAATFDVAEDCPTREKAQWGGDTYLRLFETAYLWGDLRLSAKAAREFAEDQKADRWCRPMVPSGYGDKLVEYCFLLPPWVWWHYRFSGDMGLVRDTFRGVENLLAYADSLSDRRGFAQPGDDPRNIMYIDYSMAPASQFGDTIGVMQCLYTLALEDAARLADLLGRRRKAVQWRRRARRVREQTRHYFWDEAESLFADGIRRGKPAGTFSAVTNYWMLLAGVPGPEQESRILKRLWPAPDRENMALWERGESPYSKFFMSEALLGRGLWPQAFAAWRGYYGTMLRHPEAQCVFEMWDRRWSLDEPVPRNSLVHPFGIGPMAHLAMYVAGVRPLRPGFDGILWEPMPGDLKWLKAEFPLVGRQATVSVEMKTLRSGRRRLVLTKPPELETELSKRYLGEGDTAVVRD